MPKPRVKLVLNCSSLNNASKAQTRLETKLSEYALADQPIAPTVISDNGWKLIADARFFQQLDAEGFRAWVAANMDLLTALAGSFVSFHLCSHDDAEIYDCRRDPRSLFSEVRI